MKEKKAIMTIIQHDIGSSGEKMFQYDTLDANVKKVKVK